MNHFKRSRIHCAVMLCLGLSTYLAGNAGAACASNPSKIKFNASSLFATPNLVSVEVPFLSTSTPAEFRADEQGQDQDDGNASIVGLWAVTYFVGKSNTIWDQGFEQWHSDGLELNNDNAVPPSLGNVCVGVFKKIGSRSYKLRHVTWNFDTSGNWTGTFQLLQTVTVAPNGKAFTGTYVSDSFDVAGKVIPSAHAEGIVSASRITVD
jgi:hypothetical protein